jgi:serine/tyrosine/threonine adenylyltransferase
MANSGAKGGEAAMTTPAREVGWRWEHTYAQLPAWLHVGVAPTPVGAPKWVILNQVLARELGLAEDALAGEAGMESLVGNRLPGGAAPLAQAYAGHQFGHLTTLGDGRAILLGEHVTARGERFDIQLKGAGPTPFSRRGDGRATLVSMLREYVMSEAMHALGIPTTRSLAVVATGEEIWRGQPRPGGVLTRVAASHLRVGTFVGAAAGPDEAGLRALIDYTLWRHYPEQQGAANPALALFAAVVARQASLLAKWMLVGFVHGVMNTDNMALSGETIDYGPCAFLDHYDPATVFSSIDRHGRYAFGQQPRIAQWNLARLAEALLPRLHAEEAVGIALANEAIQKFTIIFQTQWLAGMRRKLGLFNEELEDGILVDDLLAWMQTTKADFTNTFAKLARSTGEEVGASSPDEGWRRWEARWRARLGRQVESAGAAWALRCAHCPAFIPRNHLVEAALAAAEVGEMRDLERLLDIVAAPYDHSRVAPEYRAPAPDGGAGYQTFCGT